MKLKKLPKGLLWLSLVKKLVLLAFLLYPETAPAADTATSGLISEVRGGIMTQSSSILDTEDTGNFWLQKDETGASLNGEVLFNGPDFLRHIWTPRPHLGFNISTAGETSYAYAGLQWEGDLTDSIFLGGFFGLMAHDGVIDRALTDPRRSTDRLLGSRVLFHLGPEIGYRFDDHNSLMITWAHSSNGWMLNGFDSDGPNEGLDQIGLRYGYKF